MYGYDGGCDGDSFIVMVLVMKTTMMIIIMKAMMMVTPNLD
jgi:hypothetical protein